MRHGEVPRADGRAAKVVARTPLEPRAHLLVIPVDLGI